MTKKRKRLEDELKKLIAKKAEVEARITETQDQIQEETNIEIHEMVHAAHLTPEQLADVLAAFRKGSIPVNAMDMITEEETLTKPYLAGQGEDGKNIWKDEKTTVSNRELKSMVEFYKKDLVPKYDIPEL